MIVFIHEILISCLADNEKIISKLTHSFNGDQVGLLIIFFQMFMQINYLRGNSRAACAAANLAIGTRKGEQLT